MNRELDRRVVEEIFGWTLCVKVPKDYNGQNEGLILGSNPDMLGKDHQFPPTGKISETYAVPKYAGDLYNALQLAQHVGLPMDIKDIPINNPTSLVEKCLEWNKRPEIYSRDECPFNYCDCDTLTGECRKNDKCRHK